MEFVATCMPGLADLLSDELSSLGISVTEAGRAHVSFSGGSADALKVCLWSRLSERVLLHLATLGVTPDIAPEKLAASQDWLSLVANDTCILSTVRKCVAITGSVPSVLSRRCPSSLRFPGSRRVAAASVPAWT